MNDDRERLERYFRDTDETQVRLRASKASDSKLRLLAKHAVPVRFRGTARMLITDAMQPLQRRKARRIAQTAEPLYLHLGSGGEHKDGWVNVDLIGDPIELAWDLARGVPFGDGSAHGVFHEHLLEHIPLRAGYRFLQECFRVLAPGGILRVGVPDAGKLAQSYAGDGTYLAALHPDRPTRMLALQELFYWHRHTTMFDTETLALMFRAAGFDNPVQKEFGDTALPAAPDTERRRAETLYMEAVRP
jgi:predicted SAM-dependent methyltransferase